MPNGMTWAEYMREYRKRPGVKERRNAQVKEARPTNRARKRGLSLDQMHAMFEAQGERCKICREVLDVKRFQIDHNHTTNKVRGLLCRNCNHGLGKFQDNIQLLRNAAAYLEKVA